MPTTMHHQQNTKFSANTWALSFGIDRNLTYNIYHIVLSFQMTEIALFQRHHSFTFKDDLYRYTNSHLGAAGQHSALPKRGNDSTIIVVSKIDFAAAFFNA